MKLDDIITMCKDAVEEWSKISSPDYKIIFNLRNFEDALCLVEYMESYYSQIGFVVICKNFVYDSEAEPVEERYKNVRI